MCIMRNLSYHVHKEIPGADKYQELDAGQTTGTGGSQKKKKDDAGYFGGKKAKGMCCKKLQTGNGFGVKCLLCSSALASTLIVLVQDDAVCGVFAVAWHVFISRVASLLDSWDSFSHYCCNFVWL